MRAKAAAVAAAGFLIACGVKESRQEEVSRVMPIGVGFEMRDGAPAITLVVATPPGLAVDVSLRSRVGGIEAFQLKDDEPRRIAFAGLDVVEATAAIPPPLALTSSVPYEFVVRGGGVEKLVMGAVPVIDGAASATVPPDVSVRIVTPQPQTSFALGIENPLIARVYGGRSGGQYRTSWYVSGGTIGDRKQSETTWKASRPGRYTMIATSRPVHGYGLLYDVVDVEVRR